MSLFKLSSKYSPAGDQPSAIETLTAGLKKNQKESKMYWLPKTQVTDDPYFEEIKIDVDFTPYNNILAKQNKKLYNHQEEGVKFLLSRNGCILADDMGLGKMQVVSSQVFTPTGTKRIGDLKVGDKLVTHSNLRLVRFRVRAYRYLVFHLPLG